MHFNLYATLYGSNQLVHGQRWHSAGTVKCEGTPATLSGHSEYDK
jgi:hypothetical protein